MRCRYCGEVGARTMIVAGYAHKKCLPEKTKRKEKPKKCETCNGETVIEDPNDSFDYIPCPDCPRPSTGGEGEG